MKVSLCALLVLTVSVNARVGETMEEIGRRFGKPTQKLPGDERFQPFLYKENGRATSVTFIDGTSSIERYSKVARKDVESLLGSQAAGKWTQTSGPNGSFVIFSSEGLPRIIASYAPAEGTLQVRDGRMVRWSEKRGNNAPPP